MTFETLVDVVLPCYLITHAKDEPTQIFASIFSVGKELPVVRYKS